MSKSALVTSVSIQKGGVGKTTVCKHLSVLLANKGHKVLVIDNDSQGNLTESFLGDALPVDVYDVSQAKDLRCGDSHVINMYREGSGCTPIEVGENLFLIASTTDLAELTMNGSEMDLVFAFMDHVEKLAGDFDYIFIDCPPSAGVPQSAAHSSSRFVLIPVNLDADAVAGIGKQLSSMRGVKRLNANLELLGLVVNEKSAQPRLLESMYLDELSESFPDVLFDTTITSSVKVKEARTLNTVVTEYAPRSKQASEFNSLADEFLLRVKERGAK